MRTSLAVCSAVLMSAMVLAAQDFPKMETFLGYTYTRVNSATNVPAFSANGGGGQLAYNFNRWLGVVADMGAVHNNNIGGARIDNTQTNFVLGPRLSLRYSRIRPYFNIMWGGVHGSASSRLNAVPVTVNPLIVGSQTIIPGEPITVRLVTSQNGFAMITGGGLDIKLSKHASFRPIGLDYYLTRLTNLRSQNDNNQHDLRYTAGFNFTFGAQ
jgi:Outer membrane protein beta-barrel domain